jgi:uncharacterized protein
MKKIDDRWIQTYTGKTINIFDIDPSQIEIVDIAHALSMMCRFNGHVTKFYTIAEHSIHVARLLPLHLQLQGLMHDASEAYISDLSRPIKGSINGYKEIEERLMAAIAVKYGFGWPEDPEVKKVDNRMLATEQRDVMAWCDRAWRLTEPPYEWIIDPMKQEEAEVTFQRCFQTLKLGGKL